MARSFVSFWCLIEFRYLKPVWRKCCFAGLACGAEALCGVTGETFKGLSFLGEEEQFMEQLLRVKAPVPTRDPCLLMNERVTHFLV